MMRFSIRETRRSPQKGTFTIAEGANTSDVIDIRGLSKLLLKVPASTGLDATSEVLVEVCDSDDGTFAAISSVANITPGSAAVWVEVDSKIEGAHYLRLHTVTDAGVDVDQTAARSLSWMGK